jgi:putative ABC transport system permease protein
MLDEIGQDLRYSLRLMRKSRLLTASIVLTLALGIGANTLVFSVVRAVILRPLNYPYPTQLVQLWESGKGAEAGSDWVDFPTFRDWARQSHSFSGLAAYTYNGSSLSGDKEAEAVLSLEVTDRLFEVLGTKPVHGRTFFEGEDRPGAERVVVISYALWQRRYAGDANVVGHYVDVGGRPHKIIGVMPASFRFPNEVDVTTARVDAWVAGSTRPDLEQRGSHNFWAIGRLKPDVSLKQAQTEMDTIGARIALEYPDTNKDTGVSVASMQDHLTGSARPALFMLLGAVGLLLLLACANIANLLLSRAESRRREMAIREAIGAGRRRLIRQTLTESVVLAILGAGAGLGVVYASLESLLRWAPAEIPRIQQTSIDTTVLLFTSAVAIVAGILFGLAPAVMGASRNLYDALKRSGSRSSPEKTNFVVRHVLIAGQVALAVMLVIGAGLLTRSLMNVLRIDPGFRAGGVFIAIFNLSTTHYADQARQSAFYEELLRRVRALPGVQSAAVSESVPLTGINDQGTFEIEGRTWPKEQYGGPAANRPRVSSGYFEAMGIQLVQGRVFDDRDRADSPNVAVISDLTARSFWPNENPIGKRVAVGGNKNGEPVWHEIVGVVRGTRHFGLEALQKPEIYVPHTQVPSPFMILVVRVRGDMDQVVSACRKEVASLEPQQAGFGVSRLEDMLSDAQTGRRFQTFVLSSFALLAMFLAAVGIYAVSAYTVTQRVREIGIRIALGARPSDVVAMIAKQGMLTIVVGAIVGVIGSAALAKALAILLFGVSPLDLPTFAAVLGLVVFVGFVSAYVPSRRASRVDPLVALTDE